MLVALLLFLVMVRSFLRREIGIYISELETFLSPSEVEQKIGKEEETETVKSYLSDVVKSFLPPLPYRNMPRVVRSVTLASFWDYAL